MAPEMRKEKEKGGKQSTLSFAPKPKGKGGSQASLSNFFKKNRGEEKVKEKEKENGEEMMIEDNDERQVNQIKRKD